MRRNRVAFSLMEVVLVMAILVIVSALAIPVVTGMFTGSKLRSAADTVRTQIAKARNKAMQERRPYIFAIKENTGDYRISPEEEDDNGQSAQSSGTNGPALVEGTLPDKVTFTASQMVGSSGEWRTVATFLADGTATADADVGVAMQGHQPIVLKLRAATGTVTTAAARGATAQSTNVE